MYIMKDIRRTLFLAAALVLAASCSEVGVREDAGRREEINITPIASMATKAAIDGNTALPNDRTMVVSAYYRAVTGSDGNYFTNTTFSRNASTGKWAASSSNKFWPLSGSLDIFSYSGDGLTLGTPSYRSNCGEGATFTVSSNKVGTNSAGQTDIVFGRITNQTCISTGNPMTMYHANALLVWMASSSVGYNPTTNYGITINNIYLNNARYSGTLAVNASAGAYEMCTWDGLGDRADSYEVASVSSGDCKLPYNVPATSSSNPTTADAGWHMGIGGYGIMIPEQTQQADNDYPLGFTINYTLHNGFDNSGNPVNNNLSYYYKFASGSSWVEGKKYIYTITFTLNEILVSPSVADWATMNNAVGI